MHKLLVFYGDMSDTNMMVLGDRIVFIDFAQSTRLSIQHLIISDLKNMNVVILDSFGYLDRLVPCVADELDPEILKNLKVRRLNGGPNEVSHI